MPALKLRAWLRFGPPSPRGDLLLDFLRFLGVLPHCFGLFWYRLGMRIDWLNSSPPLRACSFDLSTNFRFDIDLIILAFFRASLALPMAPAPRGSLSGSFVLIDALRESNGLSVARLCPRSEPSSVVYPGGRACFDFLYILTRRCPKLTMLSASCSTSLSALIN